MKKSSMIGLKTLYFPIKEVLISTSGITLEIIAMLTKINLKLTNGITNKTKKRVITKCVLFSILKLNKKRL